MERNEVTNDLLNDLLQINNDRIAGYEKAINESKDLDIDLKSLFEEMIRQSMEYKEELAKEIEKNVGIVEDDTTAAGKIFRVWMDIKATITESDRLSILSLCEFGEYTVQRAYQAALSSAYLTDEHIQQLIAEEQASLKKSHDMIKQQHNAHKALQNNNDNRMSIKTNFMITTTENSNKTAEDLPLMNTLTERVNKAIKNGYIDNLKVTKQGLYSASKDKTYTPHEVRIIDFFRFEGLSDPADSAILYVIETTDGVKGTLIDAYGTYADEYINKFMSEVEKINKKEKR
ncbi:MAG: PA2169 family four-helix-bundle protein [Chitinophagales bacterium]